MVFTAVGRVRLTGIGAVALTTNSVGIGIPPALKARPLMVPSLLSLQRGPLLVTRGAGVDQDLGHAFLLPWVILLPIAWHVDLHHRTCTD